MCLQREDLSARAHIADPNKTVAQEIIACDSKALAVRAEDRVATGERSELRVGLGLEGSATPTP